MKYFAYGSNMDKEDFDKWCYKNNCTEIEFLNVTPAKLKGFRLAFNYFSHNRKGGAANIMRDEGNIVYGLLIDLKDGDRITIRKKEGYPDFYFEIPVEVETFDGEIIKDAITYKVVEKRQENHHVKPTRKYISLIVQNAMKYGFPEDYINFLRSFEIQ